MKKSKKFIVMALACVMLVGASFGSYATASATIYDDDIPWPGHDMVKVSSYGTCSCGLTEYIYKCRFCQAYSVDGTTHYIITCPYGCHYREG